MSVAGRLASCFPALHLLLMAACALQLVWHSDTTLQAGGWTFALLFVTYGLPVATHRIIDRLAPIREGVVDLGAPRHLPWWTAMQLQWTYVALPALEVALRAVPGLYSAWLRCWGSRIGRGVTWTPRVEVLDRSLLDIGDRVALGHRVILSAHLATIRGGRCLAYIRRVRIGHDVFVGAGSMIGPGARIGDGAVIGYAALLPLNARVAAGASIEAMARVDARGTSRPTDTTVP
ncbi:DapH/DapD/GlmU-related protein [Falsiroseomonas selenitidurans]|uniref:Acyl transferase n=1 Tax=Falsiroseomonas selenitidurans TaxID=2716335 RepID=A0ABX1E237_9PROT|nr:DapH/DapD/GlmU-related protein [Falsiroseomonas selenitidurans]NKC31071.1 acyl transferase [Falsiroseomonas selenitidurans]